MYNTFLLFLKPFYLLVRKLVLKLQGRSLCRLVLPGIYPYGSVNVKSFLKAVKNYIRRSDMLLLGLCLACTVFGIVLMPAQPT
jgi:hypothetical protein